MNRAVISRTWFNGKTSAFSAESYAFRRTRQNAQSAFVGQATEYKLSMGKYYTYVLLCTEDKTGCSKFYIGSTSNLKKRLEKHKSKSVKTTRIFDRIELVYCEICFDKTDARKRELQLKTGFGRGYLKKRLENFLKSKTKAGMVQR